ncbi:hypothetical protein DFP73DRAFT_528703 [Morchella snyderi]|nr:hypothetical protein DFP73DRAFT_528703 [Morchella snyderi]
MFVLNRARAYSNYDVYIQTKYTTGERWLMNNISLQRSATMLHIVSIVPCRLLSTFQFIPALQQKRPGLHRLSGTIILLLLLPLSCVSGMILGREVLGGDFATQTSCAALSAMTLGAEAMGWYNARVLRLHRHLEWVLRCMGYMSSIIPNRQRDDGMVRTCEQLADVFTATQRVATDVYPTCGNLSSSVVVPAYFEEEENIGSCLRLSFGGSLWMAIVVHAIGIEIYRRKEAGLERSAAKGGDYVMEAGSEQIEQLVRASGSDAVQTYLLRYQQPIARSSN